MKGKSDKNHVKSKGYDNSFNSQINKKIHNKNQSVFPETV